MSATNRSNKRIKNDFYPTPAWPVLRLLEAVDLPGDKWLEPTAGVGSIIKAVNSSRRNNIIWDACELIFWAYPVLKPIVRNLHIGDYTKQVLPVEYYDTIITNPPYNIAMEVLQTSLALKPKAIAFLLRTSFLESEKRVDFLKANMPDVYVLPNRPSFAFGGTDNCSYGWFVWTDQPKTVGTIQLLNSTPAKERKA